ncbi:hypothetical protein HK097_011687 [Rhizophlyctis rosea]|uniref:Uncharacterized protein n=1 Tax=Rhizophlyctis rosea TaxID=64517 RepID=A0AAD5SE12_9FUNG|nr:hypothetical protein HK097_011687 [Rhizophlyctis rosea]
MSTQPSLSSCPSIVYREIIKYLAPRVVAKHAINTYTELQRCCNLTFAHEVRNLMKTPLQSAQATIATYDPEYALRHYKNLPHNPIYIRFLTLKDLCVLFDIAIEKPGFHAPFTKLFIKYTEAHVQNTSNAKRVRYLVQSKSKVIRAEQLLDQTRFGISKVYQLYGGVETSWRPSRRHVETILTYDYALVRLLREDGEVRESVVAVGNDRASFYPLP